MADNLRIMTPIKRAIIAGLADGLTNKEIAQRLNISTATVKSHLQILYRAWDTDTRTGLLGKYLNRMPIRGFTMPCVAHTKNNE